MSAARSFVLPSLPSLAVKPRTLPAPALTGIPGIDAAGGLPRAALTEIYGPASSGRTSLLLSALRRNTDGGEFCAFVDGADLFDPQTAEMELHRLLWVRCGGNGEHALKAADLLVHAGGFGLVVLDLSGKAARAARRAPPSAWFRLRRGAESTGTALVITGEQSLAGSCAQLQFRVRCRHVRWSGTLLDGTTAETECPKRGWSHVEFCTAR